MISEHGATKLASILGRFSRLVEGLAENLDLIAKHLELDWGVTNFAEAAARLREELWDAFPEAFKDSPRRKPDA